MIDHLTVSEINLSNLSHNIMQIKGLLGKQVKFMAVVKADAYGHGAKAVSKAIENQVDYLSVANIAEAVELKDAGIEKPILILSETSAQNAKCVVENDFIQTVYTSKLANALSQCAVKAKKHARIHFKVDTGMGRVGARPENTVSVFNEISKYPGIKIEGIFTHLAKAEENNGFTAKQISIFNDVLSAVKSSGLIKHAANSAATLYHKDSHLDMVRVGLSMYGLYPPGGQKSPVDLLPVLEFKTRVVYLKRVPAGTPISYGSTYITKKETNIATLPVGYADGLPRLLSSKGSVLINGKKYPIVGRVCMDLTLVDIGDDEIKMGDVVTLIGSQNNNIISADDVAEQAGTINYEIVCGIGKRVPRISK